MILLVETHAPRFSAKPPLSYVGYQELATEGSGNTMLSPTFLKVSESNNVSLADLKVTGYTPPQWKKSGPVYKNVGGCAGAFKIATLTIQGIEDEAYYWFDVCTSATEKKVGWFDADGNPLPKESASIIFDSGKALWIQGSGYRLIPAGAVNPFDIAVKTEGTGNVAVGNCTPVELPLNDLSVTGYTPPQWKKSGPVYKNVGGCAGAFKMATLTSQGIEDEAYYWFDVCTSATEKKIGWFDADGNELPGGASSIKIPAGKGLWVQGSGYTLLIPAPEL